MSTIAPPPLPPNPALANSEGYIDEQIRRTRRALKLLDLGAGLLTLTIGLLAFVLVGALLDHWIIPGGLNVAGRATLFVVMVAGLAWYGWRQFIPLLKPINPVYAAQTIEQNAPSLKNSLLNLLLFRSHRNYLSARVYHALEQQTAAKLSKASLEASIDRSALLRLGYVLLAVITVCALYALLSPKSLGLSTVRVLAPWSDVTPPSRVQILDVKPGSISVARGERVEISAQIDGLSGNEPVRLRYSTADEQTVDESIRMERPSPEARRFTGFLPRGTDSGVMQDLTYWLEAGDARTEKFKLSVFERPTIVVQKIHYDYPRYTGLPPKESVQNGDVKGLDGTEVTIDALASQPIKTASVDFEADGTNDLTMTFNGDRATAKFKLGFRENSPTPLHPKYALRFTTADGRTNADPTVHSIEVTRDLGPEISITDPEEKEQVARVSDLLTVGVEARDPDYGLKRVAIIGKVNDKPEQPLFEMLDKIHTGRFGAIKTYTPGELGLKPGDVLEYWAVAEDSRPEANTAFTDHYRLKILGPDKPPAGQQPPKNGGQQQPDNKQGGENGEQGGQGGAGGQGGESGGEGEAQAGEGGSSGGQGESGESQGEKQEGQGGAGSGSGENESGESQEPSDKAGENGGGSGGEGEQSPDNQSSQGNSQGNNSGQSGGKEQQSSNGESKPGENSEQGEAGGEQSKVASGGEDDGTAFQRMAEHMGEQEGAGEGKPNPSQQGQGQQTEQAQAGESAGEQGKQNDTPQQGAESAQQTNGQGDQQKPQAGATGKQQEGATADEAQDAGEQTNQGEQNGESPEQSSTGSAKGSQKGSNQKPQADGAQPQGANQKATDTEQKTSNAGDNPSKREGANIPEEAKPGDGNPEDQQAGEEPGSDSEMNRNNGNSGSGHSAGEKEGAPGNDQSMRQGRDKQDEDNRQGQDDQEPPSGSGDKKESNSKGGQSGEQSGGGKQGAGQKADAAGKGGAGQHEAADQGAGKAEEQGEGETGANAGDQQQADGKTGQSSGDQPGNGSQQGETGESQPSEGGQQPGEQGGQSPSTGGQQNSGQPGEQQPQPNEQPGSEQPQGDQQPGGQSGGGGQQSSNESKSEGEKSGDPADKQQSNNSTATGGSQPIGGGTGSNAMSSPSTESGQLGADDPNLDYAKKQTDLVLERLDEQLAKKQVDPTLLKKLGWTEDELQRFVDRWKNLKASAAGEGEAANEAKQELDDTLRNLLPRSNGPLKFRGQAKADDLRANDALRVKPPSEYADRVREYTKGISSQRKD